MVEIVDTKLGQSYLESFGAMTVTMSFLEDVDQTKLQLVNKFMYDVGVSRVQTRIHLP